MQDETNMPDDKSINRGELLSLTAEIVSAHVANNVVARADVGGLIQSVFDAMNRLAGGELAAPVEPSPPSR